MLERTTRSYLEQVIAEDFNYLHSDVVGSDKKRLSRTNRSQTETTKKSDDFLLDAQTMTRKTRTRRPRISALQSGYCAVCNVPYNSVEDHIQSKKHQKLIGEDANYIALNGSLNGFLQTNSIPFLNLNGIDAIGVHDTSLDEFSPTYRKRSMRRNRAMSVMIDRGINPSPLSPTGSDSTGHHLRSRRNINYMTPPLDDDSLQEKPDLTVRESQSNHEQENNCRATTRSTTKLMFPGPEILQDEVWNSGRPKRACISKKRLSVDDRLSNFKTYYKVEVVTPKPRTNATRTQEATKTQQSQSPKREEEKEKGLIVKFKKLRNSELVQLNNEATNFLFPKKDDTSEEDEDEDEDGNTTTASSVDSSSIVELEDCKSSSTPKVFKPEDETSLDSMGKKKKRRTHAEAFILDNQKYYKFETPGSRLRYQGSYLPMVLRSPEHPNKTEDIKLEEEPEEKKAKWDPKIKLDNYKFAFEKIPSNTGWYNAFQRLDKTEQSYSFFSNYLWESFVLPYEMRTIHPLDKRTCFRHYHELLNVLVNPPSEPNSRESSPEPSGSNSSVSMYDPQDEDSKLSASTTSSTCDMDEKAHNVKAATHNPPVKLTISRGGRRGKMAVVAAGQSASTSPNSRKGRNPRKSPRQHASTLAILSGLIHQRKRRSKARTIDDGQNLTTIDEEEPPPEIVKEEEVPEATTSLTTTPALRVPQTPAPPSTKSKSPNKKPKPRIDYYSISRQIDEALDTPLDDDLDDFEELEICDETGVDFNKSQITLSDIMDMYEDHNSKETEKSCRRFFNGTPGRKLGFRKKKMNKTGWPKSKKATSKKDPGKGKGVEVDSTKDTASINNESEAEEEEDEEEAEETAEEPVVEPEEPEVFKKEERPKRTIIKPMKLDNAKNGSRPTSSPKLKVSKSDKNKEKLISKLTTSEILQPYVCVQKLDSKKIAKKCVVSPKRTTKRQRQRRMPGSPKSPRMLRKPRGRWYRER